MVKCRWLAMRPPTSALTLTGFLIPAVYDGNMRKTSMFTAISAVFLFLPRPAAAQDAPKFELGVGYQYMHDSKSSLDFTRGWVLSAGADVASWFALVGEIGGSSKTLASAGSTDVDASLYTYLGGPKITASAKAPVAPFVQILFGAAHGALSVGSPSSNLSVSGTHFAVQPGAGIDFNPSPGFGIRVEADGRGIKNDNDTVGQWRIIGAVVFRI